MELLVTPKNTEELLFVRSLLNRMKIKNELHEKNEKKQRKKEFLDSFEGRVEQVNQAMRGKIKLKNAFDLINEL